MNKFEHIGAENQTYANGPKDAERKFLRSCDICCSRGIRSDCDSCPIAEAHRSIMAYYADQKREAFQCDIQYNGKGRWRMTATII